MTRLIQQRFSSVAAAHAAALMVVDRERSITYGEAESASNRLARRLVGLGAKPGERMALCLPKSVESFLGLLGVLKADGLYVPIDPTIPASRMADILDQCGCRFFLTSSATAAALAPQLAAQGLKLEMMLLDNAPGPDTPPEGMVLHRAHETPKYSDTPRAYDRLSEDPAYIVFTSGSTGRPKGVVIPHRAVLDYANWTIDFFEITPDDRLSSHADLHFDLSVFDVYTALLSGASLHPVPREVSLFPAKFAAFVHERAITVWCSVPSFLTYQAKSGILEKGALSSLRHVTCCGEPLPAATMIEWMTRQPHVTYVNQYGPSETTCASMFHRLECVPEAPHACVPIGRAIPNTEVFHVNEHGAVPAAGELGELYIRGQGNGLGYWRNPEKTSAAFIQNPLHCDFPDVVYATGDLVQRREDGTYLFIERKDYQIKYMGYRVELGEIEHVLTAQPSVRQAAVVAPRQENGATVVIAAFVSLRFQATIAELRQAVAEALPAYMIPKRFVLLEEIPLNANGKVDRLALQKLALEGA